MKINTENTKSEYSVDMVVDKYISCVYDIGLWQSERLIFSEYLDTKYKILDIGCGAGRTTFGLYEIGYHDIIGLDLSEKMVAAACGISKNRSIPIPFVEGNACALSFDSELFDAVIFSFNGIMTIPSTEMRQKAFDEIYRVIKNGGIFIFTAHYMDNPQFVKYWNDEQKKWDTNNQDKRLLEFGDLIFQKPNEYGDVINFVHVPVSGEIEAYISNSGFSLVCSEARSNICEESTAIKDFSGDCKFWICKK